MQHITSRYKSIHVSHRSIRGGAYFILNINRGSSDYQQSAYLKVSISCSMLKRRHSILTFTFTIYYITLLHHISVHYFTLYHIILLHDIIASHGLRDHHHSQVLSRTHDTCQTSNKHTSQQQTSYHIQYILSNVVQCNTM